MQNSKIYCLLFSLLLVSCSENPKTKANQNSNFEDVLPHAETEEEIELSDSDREKLGKAQGKTALTLSLKDLIDFVENEEQLMVIGFWSLQNPASIKQCLQLVKLEKDEMEELPRILFINTDSEVLDVKVNGFIREYNIHSETFRMSAESKSEFFDHLEMKNVSQKTGLLLLKKEEGIKSMIEEIYDIQELKAVLSPYMM